MQHDIFLTVTSMAAIIWTSGAAIGLLTGGREKLVRNLIYLMISLVALVGSIWMNSLDSPGRNQITFLLNLLNRRDPYHLCAAALGICIGFGPAIWPWQSKWNDRPQGKIDRFVKAFGLLSILGIFAFLGMLALNEKLKPFLTHRTFTSVLSNPFATSIPADFKLEEYHSCAHNPIQLVTNDGTVYYCYSSKNGGVARLDQDMSTGAVSETEIAWNLNRPYGIAFYGGDLYISRAGRFTFAVGGQLEEVATGAVTLAKDLDGDRRMDYFLDVVGELPGPQGPDPLHQNNGIAFDEKGNLFITVGAHSNRAPTLGKYEGTILSAKHDGTELRVFARGLRNPFDLVIGPDGELFCTDNDIGFGESEELNHVMDGGHYGHPYIKGNQQHPKEFNSPIWVYGRSTLQGITYAPSKNLPKKYRNCLYVVSHGSGEIHRVRLHRQGQTYRAEVLPFARIPEALDIAVSKEGEFFISCYENRKIYKLTYARANQ